MMAHSNAVQDLTCKCTGAARRTHHSRTPSSAAPQLVVVVVSASSVALHTGAVSRHGWQPWLRASDSWHAFASPTSNVRPTDSVARQAEAAPPPPDLGASSGPPAPAPAYGDHAPAPGDASAHVTSGEALQQLLGALRGGLGAASRSAVADSLTPTSGDTTLTSSTLNVPPVAAPMPTATMVGPQAASMPTSPSATEPEDGAAEIELEPERVAAVLSRIKAAETLQMLHDGTGVKGGEMRASLDSAGRTQVGWRPPPTHRPTVRMVLGHHACAVVQSLPLPLRPHRSPSQSTQPASTCSAPPSASSPAPWRAPSRRPAPAARRPVACRRRWSSPQAPVRRRRWTAPCATCWRGGSGRRRGCGAPSTCSSPW